MNTYIIYDGRANFDVDSAVILFYVGDTTKAKAVSEFRREWAGYDAVLFEYDSDGEKLTNGRIVFVD